jgi:hypothetical protein
VLGVGADTPSGKKVQSVTGAWVSDANRDVIVTAGVDASGNQGIYRVVDGAVVPVLVPGQSLSGNGRFANVPYGILPGGTYVMGTAVGPPNPKGQLAFLAANLGNVMLLYTMGADGALTFVLKQGQVPDVGKVRLGLPPILNSNGEIGVVLTVDNGPAEVAILSPASP